jgi:hypothetical protein
VARFFFLCTTSLEFWKLVGLWLLINHKMQQFSSISEMLPDVCAREAEEVVSRVMMTIWGI